MVNNREPEIIPLPSTPPSPFLPPHKFEEPYFSVLERQRAQNKESFESRRREDRVVRLEAIEKARDSRVITYYSIDTLTSADAEMLFDLVQSLGKRDRIDLFLLSPGGYVDPAFKIAKMFRDFSRKNFGVLIPYYAKSAATLLCLGSDELVMGPASEIGPIDPQIEIMDEYGRKFNVSANSVEDALEIIEEHSSGDPQKSLKYIPLIEKINLNTLGQYRRALDSSRQYAEDLLSTGKLLSKKKGMVTKVSDKLATHYFSHAYPIKMDQAKNELKFKVVDATSQVGLWEAMWQLHKLYDAMIRESRNERGMVTTIFEAKEFIYRTQKAL